MSETTLVSAPPKDGPTVRVFYRDSAGAIHLHFPVERIGAALADADGTLWVDIEDGPGHFSVWAESLFRDVFGFHPLAIEDALSDTNVPKLDDWDQYLYLVFHAFAFDSGTAELALRELDVFLGRNFLVTYHVERLGVLDRVRELIERDSENRLRRRADHLLYLILDQGVADHLDAVDRIDEAVDEAQEEVFDRPTPRTLQKLFRLKRAVFQVHRTIAPQREVANRLARDAYPQIGERDRVYFRDVYDGLVRIHDVTDSVRDLIAVALDTYLSVSANRTNEIMKTLTIVAVLFLPLNFVVGFFGMNFFAANIEMTEVFSSHTLVFVLSCVLMGGSALLIWALGRRRGWY